MWNYEKRLQYPVNITKPNAKLAQVIISQYGGPDGEMGASMRYLSQRFSAPNRICMGILNDIGVSFTDCSCYDRSTSTTPPLLRTAAYCRVSTTTDEQMNSLRSQQLYFEEYISHHKNWKLEQIYFDEGISGTQIKNRRGFHQLLQSACEGKFDLILTKEVSRFARNTVDTLFYTRQLKSVGIGVIFTLDQIDTRASDGELRLTLMAGIAQEESRKTSQRVKWGQQRSMERGVVFGRDLLGYTVTRGKLQVQPDEAAIVRKIFQKYTLEHKSTCTIARELFLEHLPSKKGAPWSSTMLLKVLRNEKYVGDLCQKKTFTPDYLTHQKKYNHGEEGFVYLRNHHTPLISRSLWEDTQAELSRRSRKRSSSFTPLPVLQNPLPEDPASISELYVLEENR